MQKHKYKAVLLVSLGLAFSLGLTVMRTPIVRADDTPDASNLQDEINKLEKKLKDANKKKDSLQSDLQQIDSSLTSTQSTILRVQNLLSQTTQTISQKELEISNLEQQMTLERGVLKGLVQELYYNNEVPLVEVMLAQDNVTSLLQGNDNILSTQEKMQDVIGEINDMHDKVADEKSTLEDTKKDHERLLIIENQQKQGLLSDKADTQGDLEDQQSVINKLNKELNELQGDLNKILGKSYNAKDIEGAVDFASQKTGVPKGFLFGVLKMETNLGANVGGCTYAQVEDGATANYKKGKLSKASYQTFLNRRDIFKQITDELDIDYRKQKVSCNPSGYRGTGGAMGVAQFMPDTWMGYKSGVAGATGHNPPSPWNLTDGVMAMALKLDKVPGVDDGKESAFRQAAAAYLGTSYAPYINGILYWAKHYKELL